MGHSKSRREWKKRLRSIVLRHHRLALYQPAVEIGERALACRSGGYSCLLLLVGMAYSQVHLGLPRHGPLRQPHRVCRPATGEEDVTHDWRSGRNDVCVPCILAQAHR
jgi:hypothetical protein